MVKMKGKNANNDRQLSDVLQESVVIDEFDKYLDSLEKNDEKIHKIGTNDIQKEKFFNDLNKIEQFNRKGKRSFNGVVPYYPENIRDVALVAAAMPPTQVSVERLFSALKLVKSDIRASMKEELANAILFLRTFN